MQEVQRPIPRHAVIKVDLNFIAMTLINYFCDKDKQTEGRIK